MTAGLSADDRHRILVEWNRTGAEYPADQCVHQLVEVQAECAPHAIAAQHEHATLTYAELNQRANQLARHLRKLGVGPDTPVGVCLPPSVNLTIGLLAVLKANGACLPLDPAYPKDRLEFMARDAQIPVLVCEERLAKDFAKGLAGAGTKVVCLDSEKGAIAKESHANLENQITPKNLAYVIYTSGSTGKPKGVMLTHGGLVNYICGAVKLYGLTPADRQLQFSSISFDIAIEEMYPTWAAGATLVLRSRDFSLAGADFLEWARRQKLTLLSVATAYWHELVHELTETGRSLPETLRLVVVGGEKAQPHVLDAWRKIAGGRVRWMNTYGPTETSVIATSYALPPTGPVPSPLPIGRPVSNTRIYILNDNLEPVPVGGEGELHIGGPGLARGYLNSPEATAAKFIPDPFSSDPEARLYKTGDMACYLPNGEIEFRGRKDFQVKIRGFRVEPAEIETILGAHSSLRDAVVLAEEDASGNKRLVAYVVPAAGTATSAAEFRAYLKEHLPEYMLPSGFVFVNELPLTPNGKVDRRALSALRPAGALDESYVAPADPVQEKLAGIWEELLAKKPVGIRDNFFELGGHSLIAVRLMRRIEQAFGRRLPLAALFEAPSIEQLAGILHRDAWSPSFSLAVPIQPRGKRPPFFCVHGLGGAVLRFKDLARRMAPDQPFYGIQPQGIDGGAPVLQSVEEMASRYVVEMRNVQPEGPYYIGGYSFGGLVAFEMARLLRDAGEEVAFLGLLDTYPGRPKSSAVLLSTLLRMPREQQMAYITRKIAKYPRGLKRKFAALFLPKPLKEVRRALAQAELAYEPKTYPGSAAWLRASEKALRGADNPQDGWSRWVKGGVEIHEIDGDHGSILNEPGVAVFAAKLKACLAETQEMYARAKPLLR
jgi:aspartate racemase